MSLIRPLFLLPPSMSIDWTPSHSSSRSPSSTGCCGSFASISNYAGLALIRIGLGQSLLGFVGLPLHSHSVDRFGSSRPPFGMGWTDRFLLNRVSTGSDLVHRLPSGSSFIRAGIPAGLSSGSTGSRLFLPFHIPPLHRTQPRLRPWPPRQPHPSLCVCSPQAMCPHHHLPSLQSYVKTRARLPKSLWSHVGAWAQPPKSPEPVWRNPFVRGHSPCRPHRPPVLRFPVDTFRLFSVMLAHRQNRQSL